MLRDLRDLWLVSLVVAWSVLPAHGKDLKHYVFVGMDREAIRAPGFLGCAGLEGAQVKYSWRQLEPAEGRYDFRAIDDDLAFLASRARRLFIQLQDSSFDPVTVLVPDYLLKGPAYHGGAEKEWTDTGKVPEGWVARRWDPAVRDRFARLLSALGRRFDGRIEGINLPETAVEFGDSGRRYPPGFTPAAYRDAVLLQMEALRRAFPRSVTMQYANFMPGEWLPDEDHSYLRSVYAKARALGVGVGGPDLLPHKPAQMNHSYRLIREASGHVPTGIAVQDGNYAAVDPAAGRRLTVAELARYARDELRVDYLFWCTEEPHYSRELLPHLSGAPGAPRPAAR